MKKNNKKYITYGFFIIFLFQSHEIKTAWPFDVIIKFFYSTTQNNYITDTHSKNSGINYISLIEITSKKQSNQKIVIPNEIIKNSDALNSYDHYLDDDNDENFDIEYISEDPTINDCFSNNQIKNDCIDLLSEYQFDSFDATFFRESLENEIKKALIIITKSVLKKTVQSKLKESSKFFIQKYEEHPSEFKKLFIEYRCKILDDFIKTLTDSSKKKFTYLYIQDILPMLFTEELSNKLFPKNQVALSYFKAVSKKIKK